jgi:hypothetical protein
MNLSERTVFFRLPGMDDVPVRRDVPYDGDWKMDLYGEGRGAVILVPGYRDEGMRKHVGCGFREMGGVMSWARLIAASGLTAITYSNREPIASAAALLQFVRAKAEALDLDANRLGVWASSGNAPLALSLLPGGAIRCAALLYPYTIDLDSTVVADNAKVYGYANPGADLAPDVALFVARAGADDAPGLNATLDRFVAECLRRNVPLTLVNHPTLPHAFDLMEDSDATRAVVRAALGFLRENLA